MTSRGWGNSPIISTTIVGWFHSQGMDSAAMPLQMSEATLQKVTSFQLCFKRVLDPVVSAIQRGDENALLKMMQSGKNLAQPNKDGWLPLHEAAYYGQERCLKLLYKCKYQEKKN